MIGRQRKRIRKLTSDLPEGSAVDLGLGEGLNTWPVSGGSCSAECSPQSPNASPLPGTPLSRLQFIMLSGHFILVRPNAGSLRRRVDLILFP